MQSTSSRRLWAALAVVGTLGLGSSLALSQGADRGDGRAGERHGPGAAHTARGMEHRIDGIIKLVDGTPEQKARLLALSQAALADMQPLRAQQQALRAQGIQLLAEPNIDRRKLEALRVQQMALHDSMGKRRVQHLTDAAEVLTPAQRSKLAERMQRQGGMGHGERMHGGRHGGPGLGL